MVVEQAQGIARRQGMDSICAEGDLPDKWQQFVQINADHFKTIN